MAYSNLIELQHQDRAHEGISVALVSEVVRALPDGSDREMLTRWIRIAAPEEVAFEVLDDLADRLAEFAHINPTELGEVARLSQEAAGRIVEIDSHDST